MKKQLLISLFCSFISVAHADLVKDKNNNKVTSIDLEVLLETAPLEAQGALLNNKSKLKKQLEQLYLREALARMAVEEGLDKQGINAARLEFIRNNALFKLKLDALSKENKRDYTKYARQVYLVNKADYPVAERVDVAHILVSTKGLSDAEALAKAQKIRLELMQGANFSELASRESDDKSVLKNGGELGVFSRDKIVKPFADVAFSMRKGEISEPVKTRYGYHIIKFNKKLPAGYKAFDDVKKEIITKLKKKDWDIKRDEFYAQLLKENEMQIDDQAVDEFVKKRLGELNRK